MHIPSFEALASYAPTVGAVIAFSMYYPLRKRIRAGNASQNIATFILWGVLDAIATVSIFMQGGNYTLPLLYVVGCYVIIRAITKAGTWEWTWKESLASIFVGLSIGVWMFSGSEMATIVSSLGVAAAGAPQLVDGWRKPHEAPLDLYIGFTVGNLLSLATLALGHRFTIEEHFYGATCSVLTFCFVLVAARRWLPSQRQSG